MKKQIVMIVVATGVILMGAAAVAHEPAPASWPNCPPVCSK
jgi:hypothetical protein